MLTHRQLGIDLGVRAPLSAVRCHELFVAPNGSIKQMPWTGSTNGRPEGSGGSS